MRKQIFTTLILLFLIATSGYRFNVLAATTPTPTGTSSTDAWLQGYFCNALNDKYKFSSTIIKIQSPFDNDKEKFFTDANLNKYCVDNSVIGSLYDYNDDSIAYCAKGYVTSYYAVHKYEKGTLTDDYDYACCPANQPYLVSKDTTNTNAKVDWLTGDWRCCSAVVDLTNNSMNCGNSGSEKATDAIEPVEENLGGTAFPNALEVFSCPKSACFMEKTNGTWQTSSDSRANISGVSKGNTYLCIPSVDAEAKSVAPNIPDGSGRYCYQGSVMSKEDFETWGEHHMLQTLSTCMSLSDPAKQVECKKCFDPCLKSTDKNAVCTINYSSVGCTDTTVPGLITRVFQIGIGVIGLVGILQIMNAAIMRQSGDPAKIQESWEILGSLVMGMLILLGSYMILRIIGVDVLGLIPFDFLK